MAKQEYVIWFDADEDGDVYKKVDAETVDAATEMAEDMLDDVCKSQGWDPEDVVYVIEIYDPAYHDTFLID